MRSILHVDMDAFYASVEQRDHPALRGRPVIVGGHPTRGVVLAASYEVRPFGVRSAMPMARAVRLAPKAIVVPPRFPVYAETSERVFDILSTVTPLIEPLSLDEAFLDVTASTSLFGRPGEIARSLRRRIREELSLPASAGIAENKFLAKIASDLAKPEGQLEVPEGGAREFLAPLSIGRLWGVGPKLEAVLRRLGLATIGDLQMRTAAALVAQLGPQGARLWELGQGWDDRDVVPDREAKSVGAEDTFEHDLSRRSDLAPHIHRQALQVARRLRRSQLKARGVTLKVKFMDLSVVTRQASVEAPTDDGQALYRRALDLLERLELTRPVRLTGVSAHHPWGAAPQLELFEAPLQKRDRLNATLDAIAERFGDRAVIPADLQEATAEYLGR